MKSGFLIHDCGQFRVSTGLRRRKVFTEWTRAWCPAFMGIRRQSSFPVCLAAGIVALVISSFAACGSDSGTDTDATSPGAGGSSAGSSGSPAGGAGQSQGGAGQAGAAQAGAAQAGGGQAGGGQAGVSQGGAGSGPGGAAGTSGMGGTSGGAGATNKIPDKHRAEATACSQDRGPGTADPQIQGAECTQDSQCTDGVNGRCLVSTGGALNNSCSYDLCSADSGCGPSQACLCRESPSAPNACVGGNCLVDADCNGGYCSPSKDPGKVNYGTSDYYCHTSGDECVNDADCSQEGAAGAFCVYDPAKTHWTCSSQGFFPP
jgi:hypothetical protein